MDLLKKQSTGDLLATPKISDRVWSDIERPKLLGSETLGQFAIGVGKGALSTAKGLATLGEKTLQQTVGRGIEAVTGIPKETGMPSILNTKTETGQKVEKALTPEGIVQNIGFGAEQLGEFFIPASKAVKAEQLVNTLAKGITSPLIAGATRIVGKSLVQGLTAGAVKFAQTGGNLKEAYETGKAAAIGRGIFATIGEGARAIKLPERLYSTIFKNTASDMMTELKTENLVNLQKVNPEKYTQFLKQGIIKEGATGPILNETIAKQALDAGLRGSIRNMARTVINGTLDSEAEVQSVVSTFKGTVPLKEKQFVNVLKGIQEEYQDVGFNEISDEAGRLVKVLENTGGDIPGMEALFIKRLLDRARIATSFEKPVSKLSLSQQNFKTLADTARSRLKTAIPELQEIMSKYSFNIEAMETLAKEAARRGNNQALSLIDSLFLSSAFGGNNMIPGLTAGIMRKLLMSGPGITSAAQLLNKGVASQATTGLTGGASSYLSNLSQSQQ